jgi:hypothetical protein
MKKVLTLLSILAIVCVFAIPKAFAGTPTLTVASSNPSSGVPITVSPNDRNGQGNGTTQFTRSYRNNTSITLTAPATTSGNTFQKWQRDGSDYSTNRTITFTLTRNRTMKAVYTVAATAYTLTVASSNPSSGVAITISPNDRNGLGNGTTQFTRSYNSGTTVTLSAPSTASGNNFQKWQKNGVDTSTAQTVNVTMNANATMTAVYGTSTTSSGNVTVLASNDLGMHCVCPSFDYITVLPPFNTLRAQVFVKGSGGPNISTNYRVTYSVLENTDDILKADPYYQNWLKNAPKLFPGFNPIRAADGRIQGLKGATLSGDMTPNTNGFYEVVGVPIYPVVTNSAQDVMTDPLGGPNRDPYLTWVVNVLDSTGKVVAATQNTAPTAFGGCCGCHLKLAQSYGYANPTSADSFKVMGMLHGQNSSGIDLSYLDTDGDGVMGPIRCSSCHVDPAMGESVAPGLPAGYKILPGATFTSSQVRTSQYTFSDVLHRFHAQDSVVLSSYDPNIAKNCYDCHPGNGVNCYRDTHTTKSISGHSIWCTDCHGDLNQRIAQGQLQQPWNIATLPKCATCHGNYGESSSYSFTNLFGAFLGSRINMGLCSSCHGSPHGLSPSNLANDNVQNINLQNDPRAIGKCDICHTNEGSTWKSPHGYN